MQNVAPSIELCLARCLDDLWKYFTTNDDTVSGFETIEEVRNCAIERWPDYPKALPLLKKIAHEWNHSNATQMVQRISDKETQVLNNVHGLIKKQKSVTCVQEISDVLAEGKFASEEKQNVVVMALAIMRDCDPGQFRHQIDQIRKLVEGMQSSEEIHRRFSEKRDNE